MTQKFAYISQGKGSKMYTLWTDYINGSPYVKSKFVKSLSTNKEKALELGKKYAENCGIELYDTSIDELRKIVRVHNWTPTMVTFGKNYGKELRDCETKFILWVSKGCPLKNDFGEWCLNYFGGEEFCKIAQEVAIEMGLAIMDDRLYHTPKFCTIEEYNRNTEYLNNKSKEINGHFHNNGQRIEMALTCINVTGYQSNFGYINVYKFIDSENRIFTYKGTNTLIIKKDWSEIHDGVEYKGNEYINIVKGDIVTLTATIKHDSYKGVNATYIQRVKI